MINGYIQLSKVLESMEQLDHEGNPVRFQIRFVTANKSNKTGGEIIEVQDARKCIGNRNGEIVFDKREKTADNSEISRNPNHFANSTRNIILANGGIRKVHIRLIIEFNNQKVCY